MTVADWVEGAEIVEVVGAVGVELRFGAVRVFGRAVAVVEVVWGRLIQAVVGFSVFGQ